jgi:Ca2+/H+ antiporter, TMEM165/GDT1 family
MLELLGAVVSAFGVIFVAELGDKTQFLAVGFGARHGLRTVLIGLTIGYATAGAVAALVGGVLGATLPERPLGIAAGLLFLAFAVATFLDRGDDGDDGDGDDGDGDDGDGDDDDGDDDDAIEGAERAGRVLGARSVVLSIALSIAVGELGDKTQLATAALAARSHPVAVWVGATAGEVAAGGIGAIAGLKLGARLHPRTLRLASAVMFGVFGVALLVLAL